MRFGVCVFSAENVKGFQQFCHAHNIAWDWNRVFEFRQVYDF